MGQKLNFRKIYRKLEEFIADIDMSFFLDQVEQFMLRNLNEQMTEEEAIDLLENQYLFDEKKSKTEVLMAADILRAIRMVKFDRESKEKIAVS